MADAGHSVVVLSCNGLQPACTVKFAWPIKPTAPRDVSNIACKTCRSKILTVGHDYKLTDVTLESLLPAPLMAEIDRVIGAHSEAPWKTIYDGIEFGAACLGETLRLHRKLSIDELTAEDHELIRALLFSSLAVYLALQALASRFKIERIAYFGDYAYWLPPQVFAARNRIPLTHISHAYNGDIDRRYLLIRPGHGITHMLSQVDQWREYRETPIEPRAVANILDGALFRMQAFGGASTYSPNWQKDPGDLFEQLGLSRGRKTLVAYTSSTDELICNREFMRVIGSSYEQERQPFADQVEWLRHLIAWVGRRDDLQLVVRLHPRMGAGHRHSGKASQYEQMESELASVPSNVAVVWPENPMSSYNIAEFAHVALTAWSNIGLELARFGVPVVAAFQKIGPFPTGGFASFEETIDGYFRAIDISLERPSSIDMIIDAYRWTHFLHWSPTIDVSDIVPTPDYSDVPPFRTPRNLDSLLKVVSAGEDLVELTMSRLSKGPAAVHAERTAVLQATEDCVRFFTTGTRAAEGRTTRIAAASKSRPHSILVRRLADIVAHEDAQTAA